MGVIHGAVRSSLWFQSPALHESESRELNRLLCESVSRERFASMFWCCHDPAMRSLSYVNAGHCPPLLVHGNGTGVDISSLHEGGPVLGVLPDARYEHARVDVSSGDILVMYSDGLVEAANSRGEEYGEDRLRQVLATVTGSSADAVRRAILDSLAAFSGASELRDDLTIVVAHFLPLS
jgi:sigma-B regulation protein RsbU (phosphoserine phosphatase)